jgi:phage shock protein PspC (stress-responsive transcriptional regulator)
MNKVITINLNGVAYQLEEAGYEALREYLDHAARRLEGNPDKDEIIADIEQAIADKFRALLGSHKTVVITRDVTAVITEMGPVQDASAEDPAAAAAAGARPAGGAPGPEVTGGTRAPRRLYRILDGAMFSGVCNGLAAYLNVDVTFVRIAFALLGFFWGTGILVYFLMAFIVPVAETPAQKAAASGAAATSEEFIRRAKAGYYEGMKTWHDKQAHREWKRKFKQEMRGWKYNFQRSMHEGAQQWQQGWAQPGPPHPYHWVGMGFTLLVLKWVRLLALALMIYAIYSLAVHGGVFGLWLPSGVPAWIGIIVVVMLYQFVAWPIRALRHSYYFNGRPFWGFGAGPLDGLVGLAFLGAGVWVADHYSPAFHDWLQTVPPAIHHTADTVRDWWNRH